MDKLQFGNMEISWLDGGLTAMDGGAMFGVVPKPLWNRKYPANEQNQIELPTDPMLIRYLGKNILIDSSVGNGKLSDKQKKIFGVWKEPILDECLKEYELTVEDIDYVLMTHMHFDHAGGLTSVKDGELVSTFPNAKIYVSEIEWNEMRNPNFRSKATYWKENWEAIQDQVITFPTEIEVLPGIKMIHTGGHSDGHCIIQLTQGDDQLIHMGDIMPTHAHQNPLWVLAYDDYPMNSIVAKQKLLSEAYEKGSGFIFYHDAKYRMVKWDKEGKQIIESLDRTIPPLIEWPK